ncbi:MAG: phosphohydrolase [Thermoplasmata archaeon]|nr:MAG: phosphohydrolase [Thermoplasmata archaeon]
MDDKSIAQFLFELGVLRRIQREGWKLIGVKTPETVAEHSLRAAQIGYILAKLEGYPHPEIVSTMLIFHDIGECRIGDIHKVANRYIQSDEKKTLEEQLKTLSDIGKNILNLWEEFEYKSTRAGLIARDADLLELAATACEYLNQGFREAEDWIINTEKRLSTVSAKKLLAELRETNPYRWWRGLKNLVD